jgi:drug/metabolite transporter (DMT)-like permease
MKMIKINLSDVVLLLVYATTTATGNVVLEVGAKRIASVSDGPLATIAAAATNVHLWLGLGLYGFSFLLWLWLLSFIPLRYAYPISATSLLIAPLLSGILTREFPPPLYWIGLTLVTFGLSLVVTK